jgi:coenzyme F420-0:L-glutamate ligase / coenzyme F420-1:gamma-L-glutamate ligase
MDEAPPEMKASSMGPSMDCAARLELVAVPGVPLLESGDDLPSVIDGALRAAHLELRDGDVVVVASKAVSRAEGRFVDLASVVPSPKAEEVGRAIGKDARMVELILRESAQISRSAPGVLIVRHKLGFVSANAGIDCSNAVPKGGNAGAGAGPWALLLPEAPDASAERIRAHLHAASSAKIGVVISDSFGRPFRLGTVGAAIGVAGIPAMWERRGEPDLFGRTLEFTITALADQVAAAADLVAGQAAEGRAVVLVRGLTFPVGEHSAREILRDPKGDLYL